MFIGIKILLMILAILCIVVVVFAFELINATGPNRVYTNWMAGGFILFMVFVGILLTGWFCPEATNDFFQFLCK